MMFHLLPSCKPPTGLAAAPRKGYMWRPRLGSPSRSTWRPLPFSVENHGRSQVKIMENTTKNDVNQGFWKLSAGVVFLHGKNDLM